MSIEKRLTEEREKTGLSKEEFASRAGVTGQSQRNYEAGKRRPDADYLSRVANLVDTHYILTGKQNPKKAIEIVIKLGQKFEFDELPPEKIEELSHYIYESNASYEQMVEAFRALGVPEKGDENLTKEQIIERNAPYMIKQTLHEQFDMSGMAEESINYCVKKVMSGERNIATIEIDIEEFGGKRK